MLETWSSSSQAAFLSLARLTTDIGRVTQRKSGAASCAETGMDGGTIPSSINGDARISRSVGRFDGSGVRIDAMQSLVSDAMRRSDGNS